MTTLDTTFTAVLQPSPNKAGRTLVVMPGSAEYFGTRGSIDGRPVSGLVHGARQRHRQTRRPGRRTRPDGKDVGHTVTVHLDERIPPTPRRSNR